MAAIRPMSGSGVSAGTAARSAFSISSRADTLAPLRAEALARHRWQLALPRPGIRDVRREETQELPEHPICPGARQDPAADLRDDALVKGDEALRCQLAAPGQQLVMQVDAHRADVAAGPAQGGRERQRGVLLGIDMRREDGPDRTGDRHAIAVATAAAIDRAGIHAGGAADALE